jgi:hypothetical protein
MTSALPLINSEQLCPDETPFRVTEPHGANGNVSLLELIIINKIVAHFAPRTIFEIGTFDGRTTANLALNAPNGATVFTLDLPSDALDKTKFDIDKHDRKYIDKPASGTRFAKKNAVHKITQLFGDSATFDFSPWYGKIDLVFVDGSHATPYVENDTEVALKLVGDRDGLILWHDYNSAWPDVTNVLENYLGRDPRLSNLMQIAYTTFALCQPNSRSLRSLLRETDAMEQSRADSYWSRYPDVAASDYYGRSGRLGIMGAWLHFEHFGKAEGRTWA